MARRAGYSFILVFLGVVFSAILTISSSDLEIPEFHECVDAACNGEYNVNHFWRLNYIFLLVSCLSNFGCNTAEFGTTDFRQPVISGYSISFKNTTQFQSPKKITNNILRKIFPIE